MFKPLCVRLSFAIQRRARPQQLAELLRQLHKHRAEREVGDQTNAFVSLPCSHFPLQPSRRPCRAGWTRCLLTYWQGWARHSQLLAGMPGRSPRAQPDPLLPGELLPAPAPVPQRTARPPPHSCTEGRGRKISRNWLSLLAAPAQQQLGCCRAPAGQAGAARGPGDVQAAGQGMVLASRCRHKSQRRPSATRLVQGDLTPLFGAKAEPCTGPCASVPPLTGG